MQGTWKGFFLQSVQLLSVWISKQAKLRNLENWTPELDVWDALKLPVSYGWCAFAKKGIIGAYFFEDRNMAGSRYERMLQYFLLSKIGDYPETMIFTQSGASSHYANKVWGHFDRKLPGWWMGRGEPISWPAGSPDLTPCDYYLWRHIKYIVYRDPSQTFNELKTKVREAIRVINEDTLKWFSKTWKLVWTSLYGSIVWLAAKGNGFQTIPGKSTIDSSVLNAVRIMVDKEPGMFLGSLANAILFRKYKILGKIDSIESWFLSLWRKEK